MQLKIRVDKTLPVVTGGQPARAADVDGWYNRAVGLTFAGSDLTSGIDSCTSTTYGGPDSATASVAGTCVDKAGNVSAPLSYGLKYDATAPGTVASAPERPPNANGWFNRAVRFDIDGSDATSGIADCAPVTYSGPDSATASFMASCRDRAGNSAARSFALKYDATAPAATSAQAGRGTDANGWYNHPVAVAFSGTDQLSGVDGCTAATYTGPDSGTASMPGTCTDRAGNVSSALGFALKYDATKPVVSGGQPARATDSSGWYNRAVDVAFSGTDQTAGVETCYERHLRGPRQRRGLAGRNVPGPCRQRQRPARLRAEVRRVRTAGHRGGSRARGRRQRLVQPSRRLHDPRHRHDLGHRVVSGDELQRARIGDGEHHRHVSRRGRQHRESSVRAAVRRRRADDHEGHGGARCGCGRLVQPPSRDRLRAGRTGSRACRVCSTVTYGGPDSTAASPAGTCTDRAGNVSAPLGYALKYDATAPTVTSGTPARAADSNGWYNRSVAVGFAGTDQTAGVDSCTSATYDGADSATAAVAGTCTDKAGNTSGPLGYGLKYDETAPQVTAADPDRPADANGWYNGPVGFTIRGTDATSGIASCPSTTYSGTDSATATITGTCRDVAGNASSRPFSLQYDDTAPTVTKGVPARAADVERLVQPLGRDRLRGDRRALGRCRAARR